MSTEKKEKQQNGHVENLSPNAVGIFSSSDAGIPAVAATGTNGALGVYSTSDTSEGIVGLSNSDTGVKGYSSTATGVFGHSNAGTGVSGLIDGSSRVAAGVFQCSNPANSAAGYFYGPVVSNQQGTNIAAFKVTSSGPGWGSGIMFENRAGTTGKIYGIYSGADGKFHFADTNAAVDRMVIEANGTVRVSGNFYAKNVNTLIAHPVDPANKSLALSMVSSPDMKNIYDGTAVLNNHGEAEVTLPDWFEALNADFRYQLTSLGASAPNLYIAQEIKHNRFKIAGGATGMKVCWQVTGIRQDAWAKANPSADEGNEQASQPEQYLHPEPQQLSVPPLTPSLPSQNGEM